MCNAGSWRHHKQKESKRVVRERKSKNEKLISKGLFFALKNAGNWKGSHRKWGLPSSRSQTRGHHVCHAARSHQCRTESQASKKKKKKREEVGRTLIYKRYLATSNQSMCIRAKVNKTPHIPAPVWGMDDPMNRGATDGSSQTPGIVQSHNWGRLTPWDRHLNNGRRSKMSSITPVHLGAVTEHLLPFLPLKEQLTISPSPKRYKEGMNITFNVPTDKEKNACTHTGMYI